MYQASTNITQEYCQKKRYKYMENSGFFASNCSPLLCYRSVTTALTAQIPMETLSQSHRLCFMLLHYHYVSTSLTMQIPAETLSQTRRVCFMLLCYRSVSTTLTAQIPMETLSQSHMLCFMLLHYHFVNHANSCGNAIANSLGLLHAETGFSYFGARYYDSDLMTGWLSVDPLADKYPSLSPYNYCALNPIRVVDPNGDSCAVLLAGDRLGGIGHMGILVQKKNDKGEIRWFLYSKNGDDDGNLKMMFGEVQGTLDDQPGLYPDTKKEAEFESIEKFMESSFNTLKHDGEGDKYYTDYFVLPTTERQDIDIIDNMNKKLDQKYNLFFNNCSEAVVYALNKAGVKIPLIGAKAMIPAATFFRIKLLGNLINKYQ